MPMMAMGSDEMRVEESSRDLGSAVPFQLRWEGVVSRNGSTVGTEAQLRGESTFLRYLLRMMRQQEFSNLMKGFIVVEKCRVDVQTVGAV
jgi:hypothetical protein